MGSGSLVAAWPVLVECASPHPDPDLLMELLGNSQLDWQVLQTLADDHGVLTLASRRILDCPPGLVPSNIRQELTEWCRAQMLFTLSMTAELFRVLDCFAVHSTAVLVIKGPALSARCYGNPGIRQYSDIDVIVRDRDILDSTELMIDLGYRPTIPITAIKAGKHPGEYVFTRQSTNLLIEFHTENTFRYHPRPLPVEKLFERQVRVEFDSHEVPALSAEDELTFICVHAAKHFWERLMWIADVAALISRTKNFDWQRTFAAAQEVGAGRMLRVGLHLATDTFNMKLAPDVFDQIANDRAAVQLATQIAQRLPTAEIEPLSLFIRAMYRMRMHGGGLLSSTAYFLRLSFSPTEADWIAGSEEKRPSLLDAMGRPFRLAKKYGRRTRK
jgi:hypothetical protein